MVQCHIPLRVEQRLAHLFWPLYGCGNKKISHLLLFNLDLESSNLGSRRRLEIFLSRIPFLRLTGELGVLCRGLHTRWGTYIPININDFKPFLILHVSIEGWS